MKVVLFPTLIGVLVACASAPPSPSVTVHHSTPTTALISTDTANPEPTASDIAQPDPTRPLQPVLSTSTLPQWPAATLTDIASAQSLSLVSTADGIVAVAGYGETLFISQASNGQPFGAFIPASVGAPAMVMAVERPALAVSNTGLIGVAWIESASSGATIWYARSGTDGVFETGTSVSTTSVHETYMVRVGFDSEGNPLVTWLQGGKLQFARSFDGGQTFPLSSEIDDSVCDCCQPHLVDTEEGVIIAYRNLEQDVEGQDYRDVSIVRSLDGGETFEAPLPVADGHWFINACPVSGPAIAAQAGNLYMTWMDARNDTEGTLASSDIWFASSQDGGASFSTDLNLSDDPNTYSTLPVLAIGPGGRIHVAWEAHGADHAIMYATSDDGGISFTPAVALITTSDMPERGQLGQPTLAITTGGQVYLGWVDKQGARVATWKDLM